MSSGSHAEKENRETADYNTPKSTHFRINDH